MIKYKEDLISQFYDHLELLLPLKLSTYTLLPESLFEIFSCLLCTSYLSKARFYISSMIYDY
jgi:hypothetical protein